MSTECLLGILLIGSAMYLSLMNVLEKCFFFFFGTLHLSSSQRIWDRFVFQCVNVYSICVIDILVAFCKL